MIAEIIAAGSEMLTPHRTDTNSLFLTERLNELGVQVAFKTIVGDNAAHLTSAARIALDRADIVVFSGGLGPTEDDLTRECAAAALGVSLEKDPNTLAALYKRFAERGMAMPPNNLKQADVLDGADVLPNANGSAPGQLFRTTFAGKLRIVILLPGPPKELKALFDAECRPRLAAMLPARHIATRMLRMALIPESSVDARTAPIYKQFNDVETTILAGRGEIQLHFTCAKATREQAQQRVDALADLIESEMGDDIFSAQGESLEEVVLLKLGMRGLTLAVAESCTGGLLSERLTSIVNASRSFHGGVIVYSNEQKVKLCGVPRELLQEKGAVSEEVAAALADGVRERTGCALGVSITGIAGPAISEGPDKDKPVGLVFIGFADAAGTRVHRLQIPGDRDRVRLWASQHALEILRRELQ
jgi:nicotinamide-nucleotide amidase